MSVPSSCFTCAYNALNLTTNFGIALRRLRNKRKGEYSAKTDVDLMDLRRRFTKIKRKTGTGD